MPLVPFDTLPGSARVWVFSSDTLVQGAAADTLLAAVDRFLADWKAHGVPLYCGREWRDHRFLAVGVDIDRQSASGCSIDGMFRTLRSIEREVGASLVGGGRVFYRVPSGEPLTATREEFIDQVRRGAITGDTPVFDTSLTTAAAWRDQFERPAREAWTAALLDAAEPRRAARSGADR